MNVPVHGDLEPMPLFVDPPKCPACGVTAADRCTHDRRVALGALEPLAKRPRGCLAAPDPATDPIPY